MAIDFGGHVTLAEKEGAGMARRGGLTRGRRSRMDRVEVVAGQRKLLWFYCTMEEVLEIPKEKVRSYRWIVEGYRRRQLVHYECQSLEDTCARQRGDSFGRDRGHRRATTHRQ
ncbi:hypothetical protein GW17_00006476 [Ensete ventricosum]|nr:hypothetical protein GW17_00006476 [Ensete ventricosum]